MKKNHISLLLILSSVCLLVVLQALWLRNSYEKAFYDVNRESNFIFRNTVLTLRDSLFERSIESVTDSSGHGYPIPPEQLLKDSLQTAIHGDISYVNVQERGKQMRIFMSRTGQQDSVKIMLRPLAARIRRGKGHQNFIIRLGPDTLSMDSISNHYKVGLLKANLDTLFVLEHKSIPEAEFRKEIDRINPDTGGPDEMITPRLHAFTDTLHTEFVHINPLNRYAASFPGIRRALLKKISPQIFFSFFLTLITTGSFIMIYRNMRTQQRLMELKNDFISNVTHELKTPVATVSVALEALKSFQAKDDPKLTAEYLDIAQRELNRLSVMTDKILKTTIFESRGVEFEPEIVDLDVIIRDMIASMKLVFDECHATVTYEKEGANFELQGSIVHLTNVAHNLMDNALKYSQGNPIIKILLKEDKGLYLLTIKDNGMGIASEHQSKIFEKFYRVPSGDVHNIKGYGLGLSYVASVIKSHRGIIEVSSAFGQGSEFSITLPKTVIQGVRNNGRIFKLGLKI